MEFEITAIDDSNIKYFYPFMDRKTASEWRCIRLIMNYEAAGIGIVSVQGTTCIIQLLDHLVRNAYRIDLKVPSRRPTVEHQPSADDGEAV